MGLFGVYLLFARFGAALGRGRSSRAFAVLALGIALVPVAGLSVAEYVRGHIGDLSLTSCVLLALGLFRARSLSPDEGSALHALVVLGGIVLYPTALGLGPVDAYLAGFAPTGFLALLALIAMAALATNRLLLFACLSVSVLGYGLGALESANLWDYLLDPWLVVWSGYRLAKGGGAARHG